MKINRLAVQANSSGVLCRRVITPARDAEVTSLVNNRATRRVFAAAASVILAALATPASALELAWNPNSEADLARYELSYGTSPGVHTTTIDTGAETRASIPGLLAGSSYYFVVRAVSSAGLKSAPSPEIAYKVPAATQPPPAGNQAPVASARSVATNEDAGVSFAVSATDADGGTLTYQIVASPTKGVLTGTAPNFTYTPSANSHGTDTFSFKANDGSLDSNTATVTINVSSVNDAPIATARSVATNEDTAVSFAVSATDVDGGTLTYQIVAGPTKGVLTGTAPNFTYTPSANSYGTDTFTFKANDGSLDSNNATVTITVNPVDEETTPTLSPRTAWAVQSVDSQEANGYAAILAFDGNPDTYWHTAWSTGVTQAPHVIRIDLGSTRSIKGFRYLPRQDAFAVGSIKQYEFITSLDGTNWTQVAAGTFAFTIAEKEVLFTERSARFIGLRAFTDHSGSNHAAVAELNTIEGGTTPQNQAPIAAVQSVSTNEDVPLAITLSATDPDGNPLVYRAFTAPARGTLTGTAPNLTYTPAANSHGTDSFTFKASDGNVDSNGATVTIRVNPVNDAPVAAAKSVATSEDSPVAVTVSASDIDGNPLVYQIVTGPAVGALSGTAPNFTYTPAADFHGSDSFTFKANDGGIDSNTATVTITVNPANDAPLVAAKWVSTSEGTPVAVTLPASDSDGDALVYQIVAWPASGILSGSAPAFTYTPAAGFHGTDSFAFKVNDGSSDSAVAMVSISVNATAEVPMNRPPSFASGSFKAPEASEGKKYAGHSIASSASDPDAGDSITFTKVAGPAWLSVASNGSLAGTPPSNAKGSNRFTIRITDSVGASAEAVMTIEINGSSMPLPWEIDLIGNAGANVAASYERATYTYSLESKGNLFGNSDSGTFAWQTLSGDGQIVARVHALRGTSDSTRAGVMIRDSLAAKSRHVFIGVNGKGDFRSVHRTRNGANNTMKSFDAGKTPATWVKLVRNGNTITSFTSVDGKKWTRVGASTVNFGRTCYVGLLACGGNGKSAKADFRNVKVNP